MGTLYEGKVRVVEGAEVRMGGERVGDVKGDGKQNNGDSGKSKRGEDCASLEFALFGNCLN